MKNSTHNFSTTELTCKDTLFQNEEVVTLEGIDKLTEVY